MATAKMVLCHGSCDSTLIAGALALGWSVEIAGQHPGENSYHINFASICNSFLKENWFGLVCF